MKFKVGDRIAFNIGKDRYHGAILSFHPKECVKVALDGAEHVNYIIDLITPRFNIRRLKKVKK